MKSKTTSFIATTLINAALSLVAAYFIAIFTDKYELPMYVWAPTPFLAGFAIPFITQRIVKSL